ncbi:MAG: transporter [Hyphomicrobium sp.]
MKRALAFLSLGILAQFPCHDAQAAEGAAGFYLLGSKTSMAGYLPPPGTYVSDYNYFYTGSANVELEYAGLTLSGGIDADVYYNVPMVTWVAPEKVFGGNAAFTAMAPIGWKDVSAGAILSGPGGNAISTNVGDEDAAFGDPVLGATLGWHEGNWHWNMGTLLNVPIGFWEKGNLANIGFNRWAVDVTGAATYLNPTTGLEVSGALGFTFNGENHTTDYKTGTEFHLEGAVVQNLSKTFGIGINGYFYDQVSGDSGAGARLGPFEGRVAALGPVVNWTFQLGKIPVSTSWRYFHEFDAKNRLEGDAGYINLTMPLSVAGQ